LSLSAASIVVPHPQKGSSTTPSGGQDDLMTRSRSPTGYCVGCPIHSGSVRPGTLRFGGHYGAPGVGQAWDCEVCGRSWAKVGSRFHHVGDQRRDSEQGAQHPRSRHGQRSLSQTAGPRLGPAWAGRRRGSLRDRLGRSFSSVASALSLGTPHPATSSGGMAIELYLDVEEGLSPRITRPSRSRR
jgi:hypothetical protein